MLLTREEERMLKGENGPAPRTCMEFLVKVGEFFGAKSMVPVGSAHVQLDYDIMGDYGLRYVEKLFQDGARFQITTTTNPGCIDSGRYKDFGQDEKAAINQQRLFDIAKRMGAQTCNTCINYQTCNTARYGRSLAWGDTGACIYANSVIGAKTNFEGGPSALAAAVTGRVPDYGYHLRENRKGKTLVKVGTTPRNYGDWAALGAYVGLELGNYWEVPVFDGLPPEASVDELKRMGAALASFGSIPMFHILGSTPEARNSVEAFQGDKPEEKIKVTETDLKDVYERFRPEGSAVDVVAFGAPHLSIEEIAAITRRIAGSKVSPRTKFLLYTATSVKALADQMGYTSIIEAAGGSILIDTEFYLMNLGTIVRRHGWRTVVTDSAKLCNLLGPYGLVPVLEPLDECVSLAVAGRIE